MLWITLGLYPVVELLGHTYGNSVFNFLKTANLFSKVAAPFYNPTRDI